MSKSISPVHPFALGPGGSRFELLVATFYLASMLKGELPLGFEKGGLIFSVKLQQRNKGNPVDDIVIKAEKGTLSIQVKHSIRFTNLKPKPNGNPPEFYGALSQCWDLYSSKTFNKDIDCFGIAIDAANLSGKKRNDLFDTITWAKNEISVDAYLQQLEKFKAKKKYFEIFQDLLTDISKGPVHDETTWDFIRHFVILPFDFHQTSGYSGNELWNKLLDLVKNRSVDNAMALYSRLYDLATFYATTGGEFDSYSLEKQLPSNIYVPINNALTSHVLQKNLGSQLEQKITREKSSKKYIPGVFTEIPHAKDELRLFSDPVLFTQKVVEDLQKIDTYSYNEIALKLDLPLINIVLPDNFQMPKTLQEVTVASDTLKKYVSKLKADLKDMDPDDGAKVSQHINHLNRALFEEIKYLLGGCNHSIRWRVEEIERHLDILTSQILILKGKAASGKTNFICNFADTTLGCRPQAAFYVTGYDLSNAVTIPLKVMLINILIHRHYSKQHYSTIFNPETGFFLRFEEPGYSPPFWSERGPELLDISITRWCDRKCPRCYRESDISGVHMPIRDYRQIMNQVKEQLPVNQVALGGGNPNQHPYFCDILRITREEYGIVPSYTTNGRGLTRDVIKSSRKYCGAVAVSAYAPYHELEEAIQKLTSNEVKTNIHFVLDKKSAITAITWLKEPPAFLSKINAIIFLNYKPLGRTEDTIGLLKESSHLKEFFNEVQKTHPYKIGFDSCCVSGLVNYTKISPLFFEGCDAGRFSMFISEDLQAYPCSFMIQTHQGYDLKTGTVLDAWKNGLEFRKIRNREWNIKCTSCSKRDICLGGCPCWEDINLC